MRQMTVAHVRELVFEEIRHILNKRVGVQDYTFSVDNVIDHISYDTPKEYIGITDVASCRKLAIQEVFSLLKSMRLNHLTREQVLVAYRSLSDSPCPEHLYKDIEIVS